MLDDGERTFEAAAARLLDATGDAGEVRAALDALLPWIEPAVRWHVRRTGRPVDKAVEVDDVVQEVLRRLLTEPPNRSAASSARVAVLAWVKRVTTNYLLDLAKHEEVVQRHHGSRVEEAPEEGPQTEQYDAHPHADEAHLGEALRDHRDRAMDAARRLDGALAYLTHHYPPGARLLRVMRELPEADSGELAQELGTSRANVDQIRSRLRSKLVRFREAKSSRKGEGRS